MILVGKARLQCWSIGTPGYSKEIFEMSLGWLPLQVVAISAAVALGSFLSFSKCQHVTISYSPTAPKSCNASFAMLYPVNKHSKNHPSKEQQEETACRRDRGTCFYTSSPTAHIKGYSAWFAIKSAVPTLLDSGCQGQQWRWHSSEVSKGSPGALDVRNSQRPAFYDNILVLACSWLPQIGIC